MERTRFKNRERALRRMRAIPIKVREAVRTALAQNANELVGMMKRLVPVDQGDLRDSIGWTFGDAPDGSISVGALGGGADADDFGGIKVTVYAGSKQAWYARFVEHGTSGGVSGQRTNITGSHQSKSGRKSYRTHPGAAAQPFFYASYRALRKRMRSRLSRARNKAIREALAVG